jgi:hypothetical protein
MGIFLILEARYDVPFRFRMDVPSDAGIGNRRTCAVDITEGHLRNEVPFSLSISLAQ